MEYATSEQFATYLGVDAPENASSLLRRASSLVAHVTRGAVYTVDENDLPTDTALLSALTEATCVQAEAWHVNGINPVLGRSSSQAVVTKKTLGSASMDLSVSQSDIQARSDLASGDVLVSEAYRVLDRAGLLSSKAQSAYGVTNDAGL